MRRFLALIALIFIPLNLAASQVEFIAELEGVTSDGDGGGVLEMKLTPTVSINVQVTAATEIRDENDKSIEVGDLVPGMTLKIEGFFTGAGILASEIEVVDDPNQFELKGLISATEEAADDSVRITVAGFSILVPASAEIKDQDGNPLRPSDLAVGMFVKVEGTAEDGELIAREIKVGVRKPFARIRLEGTIDEILSESEFLLNLPGHAQALVETNPETEIKGVLAVGAFVRVFGRLTERLSVLAEKIIVLDSLLLTPDKLTMGFEMTRRVNVVLRGPRDQDTVIELMSEGPEIAVPTTDSLNIPAGKLTGVFEVRSLQTEGKTRIKVTTEGFEGHVDVVVKEEEPPPDGEFEVRWNPRVIRAAPNLVREVRVRLNKPAPMDVEVAISLEDGNDDFIEFPETVVIPEGEFEAAVRIDFLSLQGHAILRATLPDALGADTADLDIDLRPPVMEKIQIVWAPDELKLPAESEGRVELRIDRPAPFDLEVLISVVNGDRSLLVGFPGKVEFLEGESRVVIHFETSAVGTKGKAKVRLRGALPVSVGGRHDDLAIEVGDD